MICRERAHDSLGRHIARAPEVCLGRSVRPTSSTHLRVVATAAPPRIVHVVATRSDAVTIAPVFLALQHYGAVAQLIVEAGTCGESRLAAHALADLGVPPAQIRAVV